MSKTYSIFKLKCAIAFMVKVFFGKVENRPEEFQFSKFKLGLGLQ